MTIEKPMLASAIKDVNLLRFPLIGTPKLDGIRCLVVNGEPVSRKLKPIPNHHIRQLLGIFLPEGADGEIISGDTFQSTSSAVMSHHGMPDFTFCMFDMVQDPKEAYEDRLFHMEQWFDKTFTGLEPQNRKVFEECVQLVPWETLRTLDDLARYEESCVGAGFEGCMVREPSGPYKYGRSTVKQQWLLKLKRFADSEAVVLDCAEGLHNTNEAEVDNLGHTKRSSAKDGKVPAGYLGSIQVRDLESGVEFSIGGGWTQQERIDLWRDRTALIGRIVKYKYQPAGVKTAPRFPQFVGFRDPADM